MTQPAKGQEPSMEEILASIRRIIANDDPTRSAPPAEPLSPQPASVPLSPRMALAPADAPAPATRAIVPPPTPSPEPVLPPEAEINAIMVQLQATSSQQAAPADAEVPELTEHEIAPPPTPAQRPDGVRKEVAGQSAVTRIAEEQRRVSWEREPGLVSAATSAAVDSAFNSLAQTVLVHNARTLEDLVREMLRPMLKSWLDDNLPSLVERLVRAEIERVARGRG